MPLTSSGSATKSWMVCLGFSVSYGSWKMSWTRASIRPQRLRPPQGRDVLAVEGDRPGRLAGQLDDDPPGRGLAGARFADQPQHLALRDAQVDAVDRADDAARPAPERVDHAAPDREMDLEPRRG